ncbi:hypothetical protein HY212_00650 [Candidatus Pacearchaeota archaeon]|nr:hypothetical protein [Candidatus Pacearchaeota archaeon]
MKLLRLVRALAAGIVTAAIDVISTAVTNSANINLDDINLTIARPYKRIA